MISPQLDIATSITKLIWIYHGQLHFVLFLTQFCRMYHFFKVVNTTNNTGVRFKRQHSFYLNFSLLIQCVTWCFFIIDCEIYKGRLFLHYIFSVHLWCLCAFLQLAVHLVSTAFSYLFAFRLFYTQTVKPNLFEYSNSSNHTALEEVCKQIIINNGLICLSPQPCVSIVYVKKGERERAMGRKMKREREEYFLLYLGIRNNEVWLGSKTTQR